MLTFWKLIRIPLPVLLGVFLIFAHSPVIWGHHAPPPTLSSLDPGGGQRGTTLELRLRGAHLSRQPRLITPFPVNGPVEAFDLADPSSIGLRLTLPPETATGVHPLRIQTLDGLSNPLLFEVSAFPTLNLKKNKSNHLPNGVQTLERLPVVVEGRVEGSEIDRVRFPVRRGVPILIDARCGRIGSDLDPVLRLTTPSGRFVASDDDTPGLGRDARLLVTPEADEDWLLELADTRSQGPDGDRGRYRLTIAPVEGFVVPSPFGLFPPGAPAGRTLAFEWFAPTQPDAPTGLFAQTLTNPFAKADDPAGWYERHALAWETPRLESVPRLPIDTVWSLVTPPETAQIVPPALVLDRIITPGQRRRHRFQVEPGRSYRLTIEAATLGSPLDAVLTVRRETGETLAEADDTTIGDLALGRWPAGLITADPLLTLAVPGDVGRIVAEVRDLHGRGGPDLAYRLRIEPIEAAIDVQLNEGQIAVPQGGRGGLSVTLTRQGEDGPIALTLIDPPTGISLEGGHIPPGVTTGGATLTWDHQADDSSEPIAPQLVKLAARLPDGRTVLVGRVEVFSRPGGVPTEFDHQPGLIVAPARSVPIRLTAPSTEPLLLGIGGKVEIPLGFARDLEAAGDGPWNIGPFTPPTPGLNLPEIEIAAGVAQAKPVWTLTAGLPTPGGLCTIIPRAQGTLAGQPTTLFFPAVTVEVVTPVVMELNAPRVELKPGGTATLSGQATRRGGYAGPLTLVVANLPPGVTLDPTPEPIPADRDMFSLTLKAAPDAAAAQVQATIGLLAPVGNETYPNPPIPFEVKVTP